MLDPYQVLGVGKYDDDQTVKKSYRQLSKQYHPDNNINNPNKEAAEETFKRIQQAYEQIMHERSIGIGGPNDLRRNQSEQSNQTYQTNQSNRPNQSGQGGAYDRTATKDRYTYGFWNNNYYSGSPNSGNQGSDNSNNNSGYNYSNNNNYNNNNYNNNNYNNNNYNNNNYNNNNYNYNNSYYNNNNGNNNSYSNDYNGSAYGSSFYRSNNTGYYSGNNYQNNNQSYNEDAEGMLGTVANKLNSRNFFDAWDILNRMNSRNDVWYYYSAIANMGLGNSITALSHARKAKEMAPFRPEYDELLNGIQNGTIQYQGKADMFVPQKTHAGNTCIKVGIAVVVMNVLCGGGGAMLPICFSCL